MSPVTSPTSIVSLPPTAEHSPSDPYEAAFCSDRGPEIFRSVAYPNDIATPDPLDVDSIHAEAREKFERLLNGLTQTENRSGGKILLMLGQSGSGKTHLMRALRTRTHGRGEGYFGYLQMTSLRDNHYGRYTLQKLIDSLDAPYFATDATGPSVSGLMRLSTSLAESRLADAVEIMRLSEQELPHGEPARIAQQQADRIVEDFAMTGCSPDLITALLLLRSPENKVRARAIKYLRGERLSEYDREHLGGMTPVDRDEDAITMIKRIGKLMWAVDRAALVLCVDQFEDIWETSATDRKPIESFRAAATALTQIVGEVPNALVVISCLDDYYDRVRESLSRSILDRLERESPEPLKLQAGRSEIEARQLAEVHLNFFFDHFEGLEGSRSGLHPIPERLISDAARKSTRDILVSFARFREACIAAGRMVSELMPPEPIPLKGNEQEVEQLEQLWNSFRDQEQFAPPEKDEALAELLDAAVGMIDDELPATHSYQSDYEGCDVRIARKTPGQMEEPTLIARVCNRAPQGGSLTRGLKELFSLIEQDTVDSKPGLIRSTYYRPKTASSQIAKLLARLVILDGDQVVVSDADWRAIAAMQNFRFEHGTKPSFQAWLQQNKPLSHLNSLRLLLRLDDLPSPPEPKEPLAAPSDPPNGTQGTTLDNKSDLTTETSQPKAERQLQVGITRDRAKTDVLLETERLKRHTGILGSSGSGKTTAALNLIEQLVCQDVPVLMIDRKGDLAAYACETATSSMPTDPDAAERIRQLHQRCEVALYTPGHPEGRPIAVPIAPEGTAAMKTIELQQVAGQAAESLANMLGYRQSQRDRSKQAVLGEAIELLGSLSETSITLKSLIDYLGERDDALIARLGPINHKTLDDLLEELHSLSLTKKRLFTSDAEPLSAAHLFGLDPSAPLASGKTRLSIVNLKFLGDNHSSLFWVSQLLMELARWMSVSPTEHLQAVVMFDEADHYLPATGKPPTKEPMENLLKRARSAGLGVMLATQSPGDLDYKCRDNINTWMLGKIAEDNAVRKMKPLLEECQRDVAAELPQQGVGEFFLVSDAKVQAVCSNPSLVRTTQIAEDEILKLARNSRHR